jgi:chromosomal replication initiator protein
MEFEQTNLRVQLSFNNFIVGESNKKAYQEALSCTTRFDHENKWLWIYSGTGLGNTHLLHAIGNKLFEQQPNLRIKHIHIERFYFELKQSREKGNLAQLVAYYRELDCLLIDGMTLLMPRIGWTNCLKEELYVILSTLKERQKLVVFTADSTWHRLPRSKIKRLLNRCQAVNILLPDITLKTQLAKHFTLQDGYELSDKLISFISHQKADNIREIKGQINRMIAMARYEGVTLNQSFVKKFYLKLYDQLTENKIKRLSLMK